MIRVIRRYYRWNFLNSSTFQAQLELTVKITDCPKLILLPSGSYRGDLKITNAKEEELIILSDEEFENVEGVPISDVNNDYIEMMSKGLDAEQKQVLLKNHRVIAVLLPEKNQDEYYEKIIMTWVSEFPHRSQEGNVETVELPSYIHRTDFDHARNCAVYISIKTIHPYRILKSLNFSNLINPNNLPESTEIMKDPMHKIYRLKETTDPQLIAFTIQLAISIHIIDWARISFIGATLVPIFIIGLTFYFNRIPTFSYEILAGLIAFLIGQKAIIFQDAKLMTEWNRTHLGTIIGISLLILLLITFTAFGLIEQT